MFPVRITEGHCSCPAAKRQMNGDVIIDKLSVINLPLCLAKTLLVSNDSGFKAGDGMLNAILNSVGKTRLTPDLIIFNRTKPSYFNLI